MGWSIISIVLVCVLFLHLGMGETINRLLRIDFILFRCVKCLTFWSVLIYVCCKTELSVIYKVGISFGSAYLAMWIMLLLNRLADKYEDWSNGQDKRESKETETREDEGSHVS